MRKKAQTFEATLLLVEVGKLMASTLVAPKKSCRKFNNSLCA